jgi:thioredoxin-related protein
MIVPIKSIIFVSFCLIIFNFSFSQGIRFEESASWDQIIKEAANKNKYIFLDVFATWCEPCRMMDKNVYSDVRSGYQVNPNFISVKVQFDSHPSIGNKEALAWYNDSRQIISKYNIQTLPTLIVLNPDGKIVLKSTGYQSLPDFLKMMEEVRNPENLSYYQQISDFNNGIVDYHQLPELLNKIANLLNDRDLALRIAKDYKRNYLDKQPIDTFYFKDKLDFLSSYPELIKSNDVVFKKIFETPEIFDKIVKVDGWSERIIRYVIASEEIYSILSNSTFGTKRSKLNWESIKSSIFVKYGKSYLDLILTAKIAYFKERKDWKNFVATRDEVIRLYPPSAKSKLGDISSLWGLNSDAWHIFLFCSDTLIIKKAITWSSLAIKRDTIDPNADYLDTKANLLYKIGHFKEAIAFQKKAIEAEKKRNKLMDIHNTERLSTFINNLNKMQKQIPTWR